MTGPRSVICSRRKPIAGRSFSDMATSVGVHAARHVVHEGIGTAHFQNASGALVLGFAGAEFLGWIGL
jgi:hypothetical protein